MKLLRFFLILTSFCLIISELNAQFSTLWERNSRTGAADVKPSWFGSATERGIEYAYIGGAHKLYVVSRNGGSSIKVLNAETGADITLDTPFNMTGVSGGLYAINDIEITADDRFVVCNMTTDARSNPFKIYVWTSEGGTFADSFSFFPQLNMAARLGDKVEVVGSWDDGTIEVYAPVASMASGNAARVYRIKTSDQGTTWSADTIVLSGAYTTTVASPSVGVFGVGGSFYISGNGASPRKHTSAGAYVASSLMSASNVSSSKASTKVFTIGSDEFAVTAGYRTDPNISGNRITRGQIYNVTTPSSVVNYGETPLLGDADLANASNGDIAVRDRGDGTVTIYVLGTDQGIGAYTTSSSPLPVQFTSFTAIAVGFDAEIRWATATEIDNTGFDVERRAMYGGMWKRVAFVEGAGNSNSARLYAYTDRNLAPGSYAYRLKQINRDGTSEYFGSAEVAVGIAPKKLVLEDNFPNPFNPTTTISFAVPENGHVTLKVFNITGQEIATLYNGIAEAGTYIQAPFNAHSYPSGLYFYRLQYGNQQLVKKMLLAK